MRPFKGEIKTKSTKLNPTASEWTGNNAAGNIAYLDNTWNVSRRRYLSKFISLFAFGAILVLIKLYGGLGRD